MATLLCEPCAWKGANRDALRRVVEGAADVNAVLDERGNTALHYAANRGRRCLVECLLEQGARWDVYNDDGFTPLGVARQRGVRTCIEALLRVGARQYHRDQHVYRAAA